VSTDYTYSIDNFLVNDEKLLCIVFAYNIAYSWHTFSFNALDLGQED
jgi:hypothetical protein